MRKLIAAVPLLILALMLAGCRHKPKSPHSAQGVRRGRGTVGEHREYRRSARRSATDSRILRNRK